MAMSKKSKAKELVLRERLGVYWLYLEKDTKDSAMCVYRIRRMKDSRDEELVGTVSGLKGVETWLDTYAMGWGDGSRNSAAAGTNTSGYLNTRG